MREQRQVVARLDVERGVHPEKGPGCGIDYGPNSRQTHRPRNDIWRPAR